MLRCIAWILLSVATAAAADYPQFQGPGRDATLPDAGLSADWNANPPRLIWRRKVGDGWSAFAVAGDLAVTQEQRGKHQLVVAYDAASGEERWVHQDSARYEHWLGGDGPRATPTIAGDRVYAVSARGRLSSLELATGRLVWAQDVVAAGARMPEYGISCSPLVDGDRVIACAGGTREGGSLVAFDRHDGTRVWVAGRDQSAYSSPQRRSLAGRSQIVILNRASVSAHDPTDGAMLWEYPWEAGKANVVQPLVIGEDRLVITAGYGIGAKLLEIGRTEDDDLEATLVWESLRLKSKFANMVVHGGLIYGIDNETLVCVDAASGEMRWKQGKYGHGQMMLVGDRLIVLNPTGEVTLLEPSAESPHVLGSFQALDGKALNPPALVGRRLYVRSNHEAACFELPGE